jgi:hypothetical protein
VDIMTVWNWSKFAGVLFFAGGTAWLAKIAVIVATGGRVIDTGAAAVLFALGIALLAVGSTGFGVWLTRRQAIWVRIVAGVASPIALVVLFAVVDRAAKLLVPISAPVYVPDEAGVAAMAVLALLIGLCAMTQRAHDAALRSTGI